jgi:hypothetical protein
MDAVEAATWIELRPAAASIAPFPQKAAEHAAAILSEWSRRPLVAS